MRMRFLPVLIIGFAPSACDAAPADRAEPVPRTGSAATPFAETVQPVTLQADDGVKVFGNYYPAQDAKALILLFHQASSNKSEYATIAPRLVDAGYSALAIDQRSGGNMFGGRNRTVAELGRSAGYVDSKRDLAAALAWAEDKQLPVVLWGSSYSASLLFLVAAESDAKVAGLMAFSPGEYFDGEDIVGRAAAKVTVPVFVTSAEDSEEIAAARAIFDAVASPRKTQFIPTSGGAHGSSTLISARNPRGAEENWRAALAFLESTTR